MSQYTTLNYSKQGDGEWVINGTLTVGDGATFSGIAKVETQTALADLGQTISGTYAQAEVQAISDKVDALLAKLRTANILAAS